MKRREWSRKNMKALQSLARQGLRDSGRIDWRQAVADRPDLHRTLGLADTCYLSKSWMRVRRILAGRCYDCGCPLPENHPVQRCEKHRLMAIKRSMGYYRVHPKPVVKPAMRSRREFASRIRRKWARQGDL